MPADRYWASFWGDENVLELEVCDIYTGWGMH